MYSPGEFFYYEDLGLEFEALFNLTYDNEDYLIAENEDGDRYVFITNDDEEIELVEDEDLADEILEFWEENILTRQISATGTMTNITTVKTMLI